jgi:hypothetical protein
MTWMRRDEISAGLRLRARSTFFPRRGPVSSISVSTADLAISWYASFSGAAGPAGGTEKTSNGGKWHSSNLKKVAARATGRRHTLAVLLSG